jgi:hypothetical protein
MFELASKRKYEDLFHRLGRSLPHESHAGTVADFLVVLVEGAMAERHQPRVGA